MRRTRLKTNIKDGGFMQQTVNLLPQEVMKAGS